MRLATGNDDRDMAILWAALAAGPMAWTLNQGLGYVLMKPFCAVSSTYGLWLTAGVAIVLATGGAWTGWQYVRRFQQRAAEDGSAAVDRSYFMAILAVAMSVLMVVLIATSVIPQLVLNPCE